MARGLFTASDIRRLAREQKSNLLVVAHDDLVTPEAYDVARETGLRIVREPEPADAGRPAPPPAGWTSALPPLKAVRGAGVALEAFMAGQATPGTNVRLKDVVGSADGSPMGAGYMALDQGTFPWTLSYDEVDIVLEGELEIRRGEEVARAGPGDCIFVPRGSSITFGTPSHVRFFYVTFPADWQ
jgi:ethanolamine utilization protein EutQ